MSQTEMISNIEIQPVRRTSAPMLADLPLSSMNTDQDDDVFRQRMQIMERIGAQLIDPAIFNLKYWMVPPYRDDGNHRYEKTDTGSPV
jgi:hypothetical protein